MSINIILSIVLTNFKVLTQVLKLTFRQYPAIHSNYILSNCTTLQYNHNRPGVIPTPESESKDDSDSDSGVGIGVGIICS